jgi:hypothetical protein
MVRAISEKDARIRARIKEKDFQTFKQKIQT